MVVKRIMGRGWVGEVMGGGCGMRPTEAVKLESGSVLAEETAMAVL